MKQMTLNVEATLRRRELYRMEGSESTYREVISAERIENVKGVQRRKNCIVVLFNKDTRMYHNGKYVERTAWAYLEERCTFCNAEIVSLNIETIIE